MWGKCASTSAPAASFFRLKRSKSVETVETYRTYPQSPYISFLNKFIHCNDQGPKKRQSPSPKKVVSPPSSAAPWCPPADCSPNTRGGSNERLRSSSPASLAWYQGWLKGTIFINPPEKDAHNSKLTIARIYSPIKNINSKALTLLWYVSFPSGQFYCWHQGTPGLQRPRDQHTRRPVSACSAQCNAEIAQNNEGKHWNFRM